MATPTRRLRIVGTMLFVLAGCAALLRIDHADYRADDAPGIAPAAVDAHQPGAIAYDSALPPVGRSQFDFLVTTDEGGRKVQRVPFPFSALLSHIGSRLEGGEATGIQAVLIPLGRSLQRQAGGDEVFKYPRVVAAVVGEPKVTPAQAGWLLKDSVYLGYHEKAGVIEVISYNETAGRFEFQVVRDYRDGAQPRLLYANRPMCLTCHQNRGPIFSVQPWDETNANLDMRHALLAEKRMYHGVNLKAGASAADAIDSASDRANRFEAVQRLWRQGCEVPGQPEASASCRAQAFVAALKFRLTGDRQIDSTAPRYREQFSTVLAESWRARWPGGIVIDDPNLSNRDPFAGFSETQRSNLSPGMVRRAADVASEADPLRPREPIAYWGGTRREDFERLVKNLAAFIPTADVLTLDRALEENYRRAGGKAQVIRVPCQVIERPRPQRASTQVEFACVTPSGDVPTIVLSGSFERRGAQIASGDFDRSALAGEGLRDIEMGSSTIMRAGDRLSAQLIPMGDNLKLRLADGRAVSDMTLRWKEASHASGFELVKGDADVSVLDDFAAVTRAIDEMAEDSARRRNDVFAKQAFRRAAIVGTLFAKLGLPKREWCCIDVRDMPPPVLADDNVQGAAAAWVRPFHGACAGCHRSRENSPPGFLYGSEERAAANIDSCAERMLYRISMRDLPSDARPKTPMPPPVTVEASLDESSPALDEIKAYLEQRIRAKNGGRSSLAGLLSTRYDDLPRCAPVFD